MSLRLRLVIAVALVALVALAGSGIATYSAFRASLDSRLDATLRGAAGPVEACLDRAGRLTSSILSENSSGLVAEVRRRDGALVSHLAAVPPIRGVSLESYGPVVGAERDTVAGLVPSMPGTGPVSDDCIRPRTASGPQREGTVTPARVGTAHYFTTAASGPEHPSFRVRLSVLADRRELVLAVPFAETEDILGRLRLIELGVSAAALLVAVLLGMLLVRLGVRPLLEVERTAEEIVGGDLDARIPERFRPTTEIGRLTLVLNAMLRRLSHEFHARDETASELGKSEARMRRFLADASHELRTPIAAISAYAELLSAGAASHPEDLPRMLTGIRSETARMGTLVEDLVLLASLDEGRPLEHHPVELVGLCAEAARASRAIGPSWPIDLDASDSVEVVGDEVRLRQVVDNLLANVRAHTPEGTAAAVRVFAESNSAVIEVLDHGPGLGAGELEKVFQRFFREDTSRARASGGSGLGLAIVDAIVVAHGGTVAAVATLRGGVTFRVRLPAFQPPGG